MKSIILAIVGLIAAYVIVLQIGYFHGVFGVKRHHLESASFILVAALVLRVWLSKAQLFNNGFPEALREVRSKVPGVRDYRLTWSGAAFREH